MRRFTLCALIAFLTGCNHEPSRRETLQWMHDFLSEHAGDTNVVGGSVWRTSYSLESKGCTITLTDLEERKNDPQLHDYTDIYQFYLGDLDPNTVKPDEGLVGADVRDERSLIHMWEEGKDYPRWGLRIIFPNEDDAARFAKAMKHAVELCGGKLSTF